MDGVVSHRKSEHLDLCARAEVSFRSRTTLLEQVDLLHSSLPEIELDAIDLRTSLLGRELRAPLLIAGMTGGHERAGAINRTLARVAAERGYGFGLGSQRAMAIEPSLASTYAVREVADAVLLLGNLGLVQASAMSTAAIRALVDAVSADALCIHASPAMEMVQPGGDRDFRRGVATLERLVEELGVPIVFKETGSGISSATAARLRDAGVRHVDTSGAGGTSWVGVETLRATGIERALGELLWEWGIPTAVSVVNSVGEGHVTIATGGIASGLDVARAIALGATACGIARPVLVALDRGGEGAVHRYFDEVEAALRAVMLLTGSADLAALRRAPRYIGGELRARIGNGELR